MASAVTASGRAGLVVVTMPSVPPTGVGSGTVALVTFDHPYRGSSRLH